MKAKEEDKRRDQFEGEGRNEKGKGKGKDWIGNKKSMINKAETCAGILDQSMGAKNRVGIGVSYRPAKLHRLAESIPSGIDSWAP
jgi:hypothetical protein